MAVITCKECGNVNSAKAKTCRHCGAKAILPMANGTKKDKIVVLDCNACKSEQTMDAAKIGRFSGIVRFIGYIFVAPSVLGVIICVMAMFNVVGQGTVDDAEVEAMAIGMLMILAIISLVGGLVGWVLIMNKKVFKCTACGHIIDRA